MICLFVIMKINGSWGMLSSLKIDVRLVVRYDDGMLKYF